MRAFLERRDLQQPDGRPLFAYQVSDDEFESLASLLRRAALLGGTGELPAYDECLVLFAAEWWRRHYDGHGWSWTPIFNALGVTTPPHQLIRKLVGNGLRKWKRPLRYGEGNYRQFLGSIVVESGLPLRILSQEAGAASIRNFLQRIVRFLLLRNLHDEKLALEFARRDQDALPKSLQHEEYLELLAKTAAATAELIIQYDLTRRDDPIAWLDYKDPDWKKRFPVTLDTAAATDIFSRFLKAASRQEVCREGFKIERWLVKTGDSYKLIAGLNMEGDRISDELLRDITGTELQDSRLNVIITTDNEQRLAATLMRRRDGYLIRNHDGGNLEGIEAAKDIAVELVSRNGQRYPATIHGGEALMPDLPWVFLPSEQESDEKGSLLYGAGSTSCRNPECIIALPDGWAVDAGEEAEVSPVGSLSIPARSLYGLRGRVLLRDPQTGTSCSVRTGLERAHRQFFKLEGDRLPWRSSPPAYRGFIRVMLIEEGGLPHPVPNDDVRWRRSARNASWNTLPLPNDGLIDLAVVKDGETRFRKRIALLSEDFEISFRTREGGNGEIRFRGIGSYSIGAASPMRCETSGYEAILYVPESAVDEVEGLITCYLQSPSGTASLYLHLPAPVRRAWISRNGKPLPEGSPIFLSNLHGLRIRAVLPRKGKLLVQLKLIVGQREAFHSTFDFGDGNNQIQALNVFDLYGRIQELFALSDHIDDVVELFLRDMDEYPLMRSPLSVRQFQANLTVQVPSVLITQDDLQRFSNEVLRNSALYAAPIWDPQRRPLELIPEIREGAHTGSWTLPSAVLRTPGPWLVFPGRNAKASLRPQLVSVPGDPPSPTCRLAQVALISNTPERIAAYDKVLNGLAEMPNAREWHYAREWHFIRLSLQRFGHLPLASHDLFRRLAHIPRLMARLALDEETRNNTEERESLLTRFANEFPFLWENIPFSAWKYTFRDYLQKLLETYNNHEPIVELLVQESLGTLLNEQVLTEGALLVLVHTEMPTLVARIVQNLQLDSSFLEVAANPEKLIHILTHEQSPVQTLLHTAANAHWPQWKEFSLLPLLAPCFRSVMKTLEDRYFPSGYGYRRDIFLLPAVLAGNWLGKNRLPSDANEPGLIHAIRQFRDFCPQWFTQARDLFIVYGAGMGA